GRGAEDPPAAEERVRRCSGSRQGERSTAEDRSQENLEPPVSSDVVERAPDRRRDRRRVAGNRPGETRQRVEHELRRAGGAGREENPLGPASGAPREARGDTLRQ